MKPLFLDIFAGAGGLSEGFMRAGFRPIAHIEKDESACNTLRTRQAYYWLKSCNRTDVYTDYLLGKINRTQFYNQIPKYVLDCVFQKEIAKDSLESLFTAIDKILGQRRISVLVGGPPCQAYSLVGRSRDENRMLGDERNYLYLLYAKFLEHYQPEFFVFENVTGLLSAKDLNGALHFDRMTKTFQKCGYFLKAKILNSYDYGVLQNRQRVIIFGSREREHTSILPIIPQRKLHFPVSDAFKGLPFLRAGEGTCEATTLVEFNDYLKLSKINDGSQKLTTLHSARNHNENDLNIYRFIVDTWNKKGERLLYDDLPKKMQTHNNITSFLDRYKVVSGNLPYSHTVVAHIAKDGHYYIHPDIEQNRSLTPREAARLQSFPDDYHFESVGEKPTRTAAYRQIGNAVPVLMAESIANTIAEYV